MAQKKKKKSYDISIADMLAGGGTYVFITQMLVIYPMFFKENLLHLIANKKEFFLFITGVYCVCLCPALVKNIANFCKERKKEKIQTDTLLIWILLAAVILSTVFSIDKSKSLDGYGYRTIGMDVLLLCIVIYLGVRAYGKYDGYLLGCWIIGSALVYLSGILCGCKINFLGIQDELGSPDLFLTPVGNTNFNATYVCLTLPAVLVMYMLGLTCFKKYAKVIYCVVIYMGFMFSVFIKTESSLIAILVCLGILLFFAIEKEQWFKRYVEIWGIYILANATVALIWALGKDYIYPFDGTVAFLLQGNVILAEGIACIIFALVIRSKGEWVREKLLKWRKGLLILLGVLVAAGVLVVVAVNTVCRTQAQNSVFKALLLTDESFSLRGILWKNTIALLRESSPLRIIFGNGLNCYNVSIEPGVYDKITAFFGYKIQDPHNEFLQVFTDMGIVGVVGFFGLLFATLAAALRNWKKNELSVVAVIVVSTYLLQGLVNCYALTHLPILFVFLGLANGDIWKGQALDNSVKIPQENKNLYKMI